MFELSFVVRLLVEARRLVEVEPEVEPEVELVAELGVEFVAAFGVEDEFEVVAYAKPEVDLFALTIAVG